MDSASISALSVVGGSVVGALTSIVSTWLTQRQHARSELLGKRLADRETLYAGFISEASRAVVDAFTHSLDRIDGLIPLYALFGRIRLSSSEAVITAAEKVMDGILAAYVHPKPTALQVQEMAFSTKGQRHLDPLAEFSRVCRAELHALSSRDGFFVRSRKKPLLPSVSLLQKLQPSPPSSVSPPVRPAVGIPSTNARGTKEQP